MLRRTLVLCLSLTALAYVPGSPMGGFTVAPPAAGQGPPVAAVAETGPASPTVADPLPNRLLISRIGVAPG